MTMSALADHRATYSEPDPAYKTFVARRDSIVAAASRSPVARVASFLVYLAQNNADHGFPHKVIADDMTCGTVAGWLGLSMDDLAAHLVFLNRLDLIVPGASGGLLIVDRAGLERLADLTD
jgi:CRP/FNR family transcriptional regulator, anaerobic regulatory protein